MKGNRLDFISFLIFEFLRLKIPNNVSEILIEKLSGVKLELLPNPQNLADIKTCIQFPPNPLPIPFILKYYDKMKYKAYKLQNITIS